MESALCFLQIIAEIVPSCISSGSQRRPLPFLSRPIALPSAQRSHGPMLFVPLFVSSSFWSIFLFGQLGVTSVMITHSGYDLAPVLGPLAPSTRHDGARTYSHEGAAAFVIRPRPAEPGLAFPLTHSAPTVGCVGFCAAHHEFFNVNFSTFGVLDMLGVRALTCTCRADAVPKLSAGRPAHSPQQMRCHPNALGTFARMPFAAAHCLMIARVLISPRVGFERGARRSLQQETLRKERRNEMLGQC